MNSYPHLADVAWVRFGIVGIDILAVVVVAHAYAMLTSLVAGAVPAATCTSLHPCHSTIARPQPCPALKRILCTPYANARISRSQPNAAIANSQTVSNRSNCGDNPMLDVVYILIGAVFLGACILYTLACDRL